MNRSGHAQQGKIEAAASIHAGWVLKRNVVVSLDVETASGYPNLTSQIFRFYIQINEAVLPTVIEWIVS